MRITREFDAPPEKVFRAHTDPELVVQWLGPRRHRMVIDHFDCRTGGSYRYLHVSGGDEYAFHGSFHEVRPSELIVQTFTFEGAPDGVTLEKLVFEDLGDGRTRLTSTSLVDSFEARDAMVASAWRTASARGTNASTSCSGADRGGTHGRADPEAGAGRRFMRHLWTKRPHHFTWHYRHWEGTVDAAIWRQQRGGTTDRFTVVRAHLARLWCTPAMSRARSVSATAVCRVPLGGEHRRDHCPSELP